MAALSFARGLNLLATTSSPSSQLQMGLFDTILEKPSPLGRGITVANLQICFSNSSPLINNIKRIAPKSKNTPASLSNFASSVCLELLRNEDEWVSASCSRDWFAIGDSGGAERKFNTLVAKMGGRFDFDGSSSDDDDDEDENDGGNLAVVSVVIEILGDTTTLKNCGSTLASTREVITSIASDVKVDYGEMLNAAEIFWIPDKGGKKVGGFGMDEIKREFPELIWF